MRVIHCVIVSYICAMTVLLQFQSEWQTDIYMEAILHIRKITSAKDSLFHISGGILPDCQAENTQHPTDATVSLHHWCAGYATAFIEESVATHPPHCPILSP